MGKKDKKEKKDKRSDKDESASGEPLDKKAYEKELKASTWSW